MENEASPQLRMAIGTVLGVVGVVSAIAGARGLLEASNPVEDEAMLVTLLGLCLLFFGVTITLPNVVGLRQRLSQALAVTCMALMFNWIAFVPGPREFYAGSSAAHPGGPVSPVLGRIVFGFGAVLMDLFAVYLWQLSLRILRTGSEAKQASP